MAVAAAKPKPAAASPTTALPYRFARESAQNHSTDDVRFLSPALPRFHSSPVAMPSKVQLFVAQLPQLLPSDWSAGAPTMAIVIDTLRFTSTACVALNAGARSISVAAQIDAARHLASTLGPDTLLCGERHCHRIEGFQLGNSPLEYTRQTVHGRDLVFSTTNGTLAVAAALSAQQVLLGSLLNRAAIVDYICNSEIERVWILCAGTDGQIAAEDVLTAGAIASLCQDRSAITLANDSALIATHMFESLRINNGHTSPEAIIKVLTQAAGGQNLIQSGYSNDISAVARIDSLTTIPRSNSNPPTKFIA